MWQKWTKRNKEFYVAAKYKNGDHDIPVAFSSYFQIYYYLK